MASEPLIYQHPSTRLCLKIRSRHGTQISCLGSKHPPPDQPLISVPCLPVTQHCLLPLPPTFVSTPYFMTRREYPHDHGAPVSDQRRRSSILTSISSFPIAIVVLDFPFLLPIRQSPFPMTIVVPCRLHCGYTRWLVVQHTIRRPYWTVVVTLHDILEPHWVLPQ